MLRAAKKQIKTGTPAGWALFSAKAPHNLAKANGIVSRIEPLQAQVLDDLHLKATAAGDGVAAGAAGHGGRELRPRSAPSAQAPGTVWYLFQIPTQDSQIVTGNEISSAKADIDQSGQPIVSLSYKNGGDRTSPTSPGGSPARGRPRPLWRATRKASTTRSSSTTSWSPRRR